MRESTAIYQNGIIDSRHHEHVITKFTTYKILIYLIETLLKIETIEYGLWT